MGFVQRKHFSVERRPKLLKDFLTDDSNSCSSSGFKSFPRKPLNPIEVGHVNSVNVAGNSLTRSRSKAGSSTISAFQAMINAVKNIHFITAVKPPSILPRSFSRKLSRRSLREKSTDENKENEIKPTFTVTVKDIMRWRSFQDRVDIKSPPLDLPSSPHHYTTTTTTTTTTGSLDSTPRSSTNGSSWCDSDFTSEYLPWWNDNSSQYHDSEKEVVEVGKKYLPCVGEESMEESQETTERRSSYGTEGPKEDAEEQHSPVCVIDIEFEEDGESSSSFDQSFASVERARQKLMQKIRRFESLARLDPVNLEEWMSEEENSSSVEDHDEVEEEEEGVSCEVEEKARRLLNDVKAATFMGCWRNDEDQLLIDFFREELCAQKECRGRNVGFDWELVNRAKNWMNGEHGVWVGWEVEGKRRSHVREMEKQGAGDWCKFDGEREEVGVAVENAVIDALVDELLLDLVSS